jgi:hypothetical protein
MLGGPFRGITEFHGHATQGVVNVATFAGTGRVEAGVKKLNEEERAGDRGGKA